MTQLLSVVSQRLQKSVLSISTSEAFIESVREPLFQRIVRRVHDREWLEQCFEEGCKAYLVTAIHVVKDGRIARTIDTSTMSGSSLQLPVSASITIGFLLPLTGTCGEILEPKVSGERSQATGTSHEFSAPGEIMFSFHVVKFVSNGYLPNWSTALLGRDNMWVSAFGLRSGNLAGTTRMW